MLAFIGEAGLAPGIWLDAGQLCLEKADHPPGCRLQFRITALVAGDRGVNRHGRIHEKAGVAFGDFAMRGAFDPHAAAIIAMGEMTFGFAVDADRIVAQVFGSAIRAKIVHTSSVHSRAPCFVRRFAL